MPIVAPRPALSARDMHAGQAAVVPAAVERAFDLRGQLQQQSVIRLPRLRLDAERQTAFLGAERQRDAGMPQRLASGV